MTDSILYIADPGTETPTDVVELERLTSIPVECVHSITDVRDRASEASCIVFAADSTDDGPTLGTVASLCPHTVVIHYGGPDSSVERGAAPVDGYVRQHTDSSVVHLADEVNWHRRRDCEAADGRLHGDGPGNENRAKIARLHEMVTRIIACREEDRLFELAIETADGVLEFDASSITVYEDRDGEGWMVPKAASSSEIIDRAPDALPLGTGIVSRTFETGESARVDDLDAEPDAVHNHDAYRSGLSAPIGEFGVFQAISVRPGAYNDTDLELAEILATHVAETVRRIRLENRLRTRRERVTRLHEGTARIVAADDESEIYELTVDAAENILEFDNCVLLTVENGRFVPEVTSSEMPERYNQRQPLEFGVMGETYRTGRAIRVDNTEDHPFTEREDSRYRSVLSVPIDEFGVFQTVAERSGAFDEEDEELAELLVSHVTEEVARVRAEAELVAERDRLSALFDNVPDPTVRYEFDGTDAIVRDVNTAFERQFGYDRETVLGENIDDYIVPPALEEEAKALNETLIAGKSLRAMSQRRTADGMRDVLINVVPLEMGERGVEGFSIYTDITDQKRRERELTEQNERLDEFASIVSHDLRNPLNVARGYLELAMETGNDDHVAEVEAAHDRMAALIDKLLTLSRQGEVIDDTEAVAVGDATRRAWATVETDDAVLEFGEDRVLEADPSRLVELLENLLRNAVEHGSTSPASITQRDAVEHGSTSPPSKTQEDAVEHGSANSQHRDGTAVDTDDPGDERPLTVRVGATDDGLYVADNGPGIPNTDRESVFESGYTTARDGTGYGLAIVEQIADAHGWDVRVTESVDGGARFEIGESALENEARLDDREPEMDC